jgi:serine-type D-Ala-D-Ala carboxypeptidase
MMTPMCGSMRFTTVEPGDVGMSAERLGWARDLMTRHFESGGTPSMAAVVLRRGRTVFAETMGVKEPDGPPLELSHLWPIASAGKPITSAVALSLVEDGVIGLYDPVVEFFPELDPELHGEVLIHHLLTHTTGWESAQRTGRLAEMVMAGAVDEPPPGADPIIHLFLSAALRPVIVGAPGAQMDYDTISFELLAEIVRRVTGEPLDAAVRERILEPLSLQQSALRVSDELSRHVVRRSPDLPLGSNQILTFDGRNRELDDFGGGGMYMSPGDLVAFGQMILQGGTLDGTRVLSPATARSMVTNQVPGIPALVGDRTVREASWGYGFTVITTRPFNFFVGGLLPVGSVAHPGAGGINFWIDLENEIVGVLFEVITEMSEFFEPVSGIGHRFQDVIAGAVES